MTRALWYLVWLALRVYAFTRPSVVIKLEGSPYVTRWFLTGSRRELRAAIARGETGMPGLWLHKFHRADADRRLHNHPHELCETRVLRGGYTELRAYGTRRAWVHEYRAGDTSRITAAVWHRVAALHGETWTLFRAYRKHGRGWGFRERGVTAFNVEDPPTPTCEIVTGVIVSKRWIAEAYAARLPGRTIEEIEVTDPEVIASFEDGGEAAWCERVGLVAP